MNNEQIGNINLKKINTCDASKVATKDEEGNPISFIYDDIWDFQYSRQFSKSQESRFVSFENIPQEYKKEVQHVLALMLKNNPKMALETLKYERGNLVRIAKLLGSTEWSKLNNDGIFRKFKSQIKDKRFGISTVKGTLITVNQLFKFGLTNRLIKDLKVVSFKLACKSKTKKLQHIAIPEHMATRIFKAAESTVNEFYPYKKEISDAYARYYQTRKEFLEANPHLNSKTFWNEVGCNLLHSVGIDDFEVRSSSPHLDEIKTACLILILGYSGVRHGEGLSIGLDSYQTKEYNGFEVPYLIGFSTKKNEAGLPTQETWVTHPIVKKALKLLFSITEFARDIYKEMYANDEVKLAIVMNGLLSTNIAKHKRNVLWSTNSFTSYLAKFLEKHSITATKQDVIEFDKLNPTREGLLKEGGYLPKLSSHDFRRTFAVFLMRNKLGGIMALKHQYKHLNVVMTQWYSNNSELVRALDLQIDDELQEMMNEANIMIMTETAFEIFNSPTLSGGEGERIDRERSKSEYEGSIYISREELERQVRSGNLSVVEHPTGFCFNPSCDRICSSEISSVICKHEAVTRDKALERVPKRQRLIQKFENLIQLGSSFSSIRNRIFIEIKAIEHVLQQHKIEFESFQEPVID